MGIKTKISWCDSTVNFWYGCTKVSPACTNCYAERWAKRYSRNFSKITRTSDTTFYAPLKWKESKRIFVCSLSDFFHPDVNPIWRQHAWDIMLKARWHTYLLLTKRPENIKEMLAPWFIPRPWPERFWFGVTVENQEQVKRAEIIQDVNCRVKFISMEPLLTPVTFSDGLLKKFQWVIVGGESGPKARPMASAWADDIYSQCREAGVKFFFKQRGNAFLEENMECESIKEFPL